MYLESRKYDCAAYTRGDLLAVLGAVGLLGTIGLSGLASSAVRSDSAVCGNNLRQVGRAFNMWTSDHGGENPWWVSYIDGGSYVRPGTPVPPMIDVPGAGPLPSALHANAWFQFAFISQELTTPAVLVCPTDRTKTRAQEFSNNSGRGYFAVAFQNNATSYFIGAHSISLFPSAMLSGDRSLKEENFNSGCPANMGVMSSMILGTPSFPVRRTWSSNLHPSGGNLLLNDGRVEEFSDDGLTKFLTVPISSATHFLKPN